MENGRMSTTATLTYSAVGATRADDLVTHPPTGFRPIERVQRIGHGQAFFETARDAVLTWKVQENSGFGVLDTDLSRHIIDGDDAIMAIPMGPLKVKAPVRVVYVVDEPGKAGFAYGTLPGHPEDGEESWLVTIEADDSVWMTVRAFSRPSNPFWKAVSPALRIVQEYYTIRYLRALAQNRDGAGLAHSG
jgi:uncharacterized protein (UPF0548 family)